VCLVNVDGEVLAVHDVCTHALESLSGGWVEGDTIECPRHGAQFSLRTGEVLTPPATVALPTYGVEVRDGRVLVDPSPSREHPLIR
jgi:nitrite reductase/ring-hydroxylating ferredoxin subunit